MFKVGNEQDRLTWLEAERGAQQNIERRQRQRLYKAISDKFIQKTTAEWLQEKFAKQRVIDSLQASRDGLRDRLQGLQEGHRADVRHHEQQIKVFTDLGYPYDVENLQQTLEELESDYQRDRTDLEDQLSNIESELMDLTAADD